MKRLLSLILALLMTVALFGVSGAMKYAYAEGDGEEPSEPAEPVNPYVGLWEITGRKEGEVYTPYGDGEEKIYMDFLPNGVIYAILYDGEDADEDYAAYKVTGENALTLFEGDDPIPGVYDPETGIITVTAEAVNGPYITYLQRVTTDPLPDIRALVDHAQEERTYYGYLMMQGEQSISMLEALPAMGMDPRDVYLTLNPDGTGYLQFGDEEAGGDITWTETEFTADGESVPYTRQGDHIQLTLEGMLVEFAPEGEVEALLAIQETKASADEPIEFTEKDVIGSWEFTKGKTMGVVISASEMGQSMSLVLKEGGKASMTTNGNTNDRLEWRIEDGVIILGVGTYEAFRVTYDGTVLILNTMGVDMIFERVN